MSKNLVIVESPAKVKTIKKFLGTNYEVDASGGHVRDLPKSSLGVDVEHDYEPKYITIRGKGELLTKLKKEAKAALKEGKLTLTPTGDGETITGQLPAAGQSVLPGSEVLVYLGVPTDERTVTVPDFTGMNRQQASQAAGQLGLSIIPMGSGEISANVTVCSQKEPAGTELAVGSAVTLQFADTTARD